MKDVLLPEASSGFIGDQLSVELRQVCARVCVFVYARACVFVCVCLIMAGWKRMFGGVIDA